MTSTYAFMMGYWVILAGMAVGCSGNNSSTGEEAAGATGSPVATSGGQSSSGAKSGSSTGGKGTTSPSGGAGGKGGTTKPPTNAGSGQGSGGKAGTPVAYIPPVEKIDLKELPTEVPRVQLEVATSAIEQLDANPFSAADVLGAFVDGAGTRYEGLDVNYRGAYALQTLIRNDAPQRNWKVKFTKAQKYRERREWNYTFEPQLRQKLAYDLMKFAGVRVPSARHVVLEVNGESHGLYLEYEDPDNKDWLADKFGDDEGDLYKGAYDVPNEPRYFATFEILGETDADYFDHFRKTTNNDVLPDDYSALRTFIAGLNQTSDQEFPAWIKSNFDTASFISYLVVGNFISHWDGYPQRPKNLWIYNIPSGARWVFIPWDMDGTFQTVKSPLNNMGTKASIFHQMDEFVEYSGRHPEEGTERPLVRRLMQVPEFRAAYVTRYREALTTFLDQEYLLDRVSKLSDLVAAHVPEGDQETMDESTADMRSFIEKRYTSVVTELAAEP